MENAKPVKILAVDDDSAITEYYTRLLKGAGYQVETAAEATGAIILFRESPADLLILDVVMPSGGGRQVLDIISGFAEKSVPIVFVTGLPEKILPWVSGMPNVRVLKKPVDSKELLSVIAALLPKPA
jgi:DNA-binding response OmpR family regulator